MSIDIMLAALRESQTVPTKREAGRILARGGWAVFPLPDNMKFDNGLGAFTYKHASDDPRAWDAACDVQMARSECLDVNVGLAPAFCSVPLLVVDLDGQDAIDRFAKDAWDRGHADLGLWLRANTTRPDQGRHAYFVSPDGMHFGNSQHAWGGDIRSAKGHVVMPPSTTGIGRYTWVGELLNTAPDWVVEGLAAKTPTDSPDAGNHVTDAQVFDVLASFSQGAATPYGKVALDNLLREFEHCVPGTQRAGRNPTLQRVLCRALDLSMDGHLDATEAVREVTRVYVHLVSGDPNHAQPEHEIRRTIESWVRRKSGVLEAAEANAGAMAWASGRSSAEAASELLHKAREARTLIAPKVSEYLRAAKADRETQPRRRVSSYDFHKDVNK